MDDQISALRARLEKASQERGKLTDIAYETRISSRTIYGLIRGERKPHQATVSALLAYFKREDRKAERAAK